ncbi:MAG: hypothetical protein L0I76_20530 [Pseudonocardia sp.]|nr:hypothetical protein [Pseudonocardia sp.]
MTIADGAGAADRRRPRASGRGRKVRRETNRLHRRTERMEDLLNWVLGLVVAAGLLVTILAAGSAHDAIAERAAAESKDRIPVQAVVVEDGPATVGTPVAGAQSSAIVRWTGADGIERTGRAEVLGARKAGTAVRVWAGPDGRLVPAPMTSDDATAAAVVAGTTVTILWGAGCVGLGWAVFAWSGRRYGRAWAGEWERIEPEWSGRRHMPRTDEES